MMLTMPKTLLIVGAPLKDQSNLAIDNFQQAFGVLAQEQLLLKFVLAALACRLLLQNQLVPEPEKLFDPVPLLSVRVSLETKYYELEFTGMLCESFYFDIIIVLFFKNGLIQVL